VSYLEAEALGLDIDWNDVLSKAQTLWDRAGPTLKAGMAVIEDPYLPQVACEVLRLNAIQEGRRPGPKCPAPRNPSSKKGVGLSYAVKPLQAFVYARQRPWIVPAAILGVVGLSFAAGYWARGRKR
jgi:hypothetical protein